MKILAFHSSYRKNGNTARVLDLLEQRFKTLAAQANMLLEFEEIALAQMDIRPCRGCRACFDRGEEKCPVQDDVLVLKDRILAADAVLWASPVYVDDVNGTIKIFMDRLAHVCHRPQFAGISAFALVSSGTKSTSHALSTFRTAFMTWGFHLLGGAGFVTGALMNIDEIEQRNRKKLDRTATHIFTSLQHKDALRPSFLSLMVFKIQQRAWTLHPDGSFDYTYWQEQGWLDPDCHFFIPHHASPFKVFLARAAGAALAPFVS